MRLPSWTTVALVIAVVVAGCGSPETIGNRSRDAAADVTARGAAGVTDEAAKTKAAARPNTAPDDRISPSRDVTVPAGTPLPVVLDTPVGSDTSRVEDRVEAHLARAVAVHGVEVIPAGSRVTGVVVHAQRSGKVRGRAAIAVRFDSLLPRSDDERYRIDTAPVERMAPATKKKDALEIGIPAAGGAIIGGLLGGGKGAAIGTMAGGGAGTAVVLSTRGREVHLLKGAALSLRLTRPVSVRLEG